jgi:glycosyltransferase involved in cell wall biosynthesis
VTSKRLLVLATSFFPDEPDGAARLAFDLASDLARKGHEVWYLCQTRDDSKPEYIFQEGLHVLRYCLSKVTRFDALRVFKHFSAVKRLLVHYLPEPPAIVHGHDLLPYVSAIKSYCGRGKSYYTVHSPAVEELAIVWRAQGLSGYVKLLIGLPLIWYLERFALAASDGIDAKSEYTVGRMAHHYGGSVAGRICVIPGWVDTARFKPASQSVAIQARQRLNWPTDKPVLFAVRRLEARMGLDRLLYAIAQLRDEGYDFYTAIGGAGSQLTMLMQLGNRLGLLSHLAFMGRISDDDLLAAYNACDASIIPTGQLECFGIIALEAMACGKPVLVTPVGALPEVVGRFEPQWIAPSNTSEGLAEILRRYLDTLLPLHEANCIAEYVEANYRTELGLKRSREWLGVDDS